MSDLNDWNYINEFLYHSFHGFFQRKSFLKYSTVLAFPKELFLVLVAYTHTQLPTQQNLKLKNPALGPISYND